MSPALAAKNFEQNSPRDDLEESYQQEARAFKVFEEARDLVTRAEATLKLEKDRLDKAEAAVAEAKKTNLQAREKALELSRAFVAVKVDEKAVEVARQGVDDAKRILGGFEERRAVAQTALDKATSNVERAVKGVMRPRQVRQCRRFVEMIKKAVDLFDELRYCEHENIITHDRRVAEYEAFEISDEDIQTVIEYRSWCMKLFTPQSNPFAAILGERIHPKPPHMIKWKDALMEDSTAKLEKDESE